MFYNIGPLGLYRETFNRCNKLHSRVSWCLCYCQFLFTDLDKHPSLLRYDINFGPNKFYNIGPDSYLSFVYTVEKSTRPVRFRYTKYFYVL
jgi:hypothetical protein